MKVVPTDIRPSGMTLVELLVCLGIITLLMALLLPAVQAAREAARAATCRQRLGQLALATQNFEQSMGYFPPYSYVILYDSQNNPRTKVGMYSVQVMLLPYLEQTSLYNAINLDTLRSIPSWTNSTAAARTVSVFLCPSDPYINFAPTGNVSFRANQGPGVYEGRLGFGGAFDTRPLPIAAFTDGLSNTLAFSEKPVGTDQPTGPFSTFRDSFLVPIDGSPNNPTTDWWVATCRAGGSPEQYKSAARIRSGRCWMPAGAFSTAFFTSTPPNSSIPDCGYTVSYGEGLFTARSYHPGGVNAALCDGSVRWFASGTNSRVWQALGSRAKGEVVAP
ncbi:MAG TPA: DUF1559 domain-containing protein [Isosphaeraceae bacterium]|nr:DUF1559 domain-containing protein [Isosphaeraceae bacterium]